MTHGLGEYSQRSAHGVCVEADRPARKRLSHRVSGLPRVIGMKPRHNCVALGFSGECFAWIWIGGEPKPIPCHNVLAVWPLAANIALRLKKRLVVAK